MTHVTCRLTAKNRDQLRNSTLGNRVWATFTKVRWHNSDSPTAQFLYDHMPPGNHSRSEKNKGMIQL